MTAGRRSVGKALLVFAASLGLVAAAVGQPPLPVNALTTDSTPLAATQTEAAISRAATFREAAGLRADFAYVLDSMSDRAFSSSDWGIPLSASELADLAERMQVRARVAPAFDVADKLTESAGQYIDQLHGGVPVFLTTTDPRDFGAKLGASIPGGTPYRIEQVQLTLGELQELRARIQVD